MNLTLKEIKRRAVRIFETKAQAVEYISKFGFRPDESLRISRHKRKWVIVYTKK